jgi:hypothetical protein
MNPATADAMTMTPRFPNAPLAALAALLVALAGCTAGTKDGAGGLGDQDRRPVLYLNVTVDGQTYRYSTDQLGAGGNGTGTATGTVTGSVTSGTGSVQGNATSGNTTAQGNATAGSGSATATGTYGNGTGPGGTGGTGGTPSGQAPLDVRVEIGASGLPKDLPFNWTFEWGDAASTSGNGTSANATASPGAAPQQAREQGSTLPASLQHTYTRPGTHQMVFGLQLAQRAGDVDDALDADGGPALQTLRAAIDVQGGGPGGVPEPGSFLGNQTDTFGGSALASAPPLCGTLDTFEWRLNETFGGNASEVQRVTVGAFANGTAGDITLTLRHQNGTEVASGSAIDREGTFPPGSYAIEVEACPAVDLEYTVVAVGQHFARRVA